MLQALHKERNMNRLHQGSYFLPGGLTETLRDTKIRGRRDQPRHRSSTNASQQSLQWWQREPKI